MISCKNHPERESAGMCVACGKPFCEDCLVDIKNKYFCKPCIAERLRRIEERKKAAEQEMEMQQSQPSPEPARVIVENIPQHPAKKKSTTLLLWLFLGGFGAHRFYTGHVLTGFVYICLWFVNVCLSWSSFMQILSDPSNSYSIIMQNSDVGSFISIIIGLWLFIDFVCIISNVFTDKYGNSLM